MKKIKQNIRQSWKLLVQNRLFSGVSILTTAVTITYLMVLWMGYMFHNSNIAPEDKRERTTHTSSILETTKNKEKKHTNRSHLSVEMAKLIIAPIKGAELIRVYADKQTVIFKLPNNDRIKLSQAITDENVWEQFSYQFVEGRPFTKEEVQSGIDVAVISRSTAKKLFHGTEDIVGREITPEFPEKTYRVVGVVEDVSALFRGAFAQIWTPFPNDRQTCKVDIIRKEDVSKESLDAEFIENLAKYSQAHPKKNYEYMGNESMSDYYKSEAQKAMLIFSLILLIVPAVNGMGLVASNMSERTSEIGIRKAYGANRKSIIWQLLYENMFSTGIGAFIGLTCSMLVTIYLGKFLLVSRPDVSRELYSIPFNSLFDIRIFALALFFCFVFNIMSVYIPAMRATRSSIVDAVKGGKS